jgi:HEAT repeat protein
MTKAVDEQIELLASRDWRLQKAARDALSGAGETGREAVVHALGHPSSRIRRYAADFFDHNGDDRCVPQLRRLLNDPVPVVRWQALHSLSCQRCKPNPLTVDVVPDLIGALDDSSPRVRATAAAILGLQPGDPRAVEALHSLLEGEAHPKVRRFAHQALRLQDPSYRAETDRRARERQSARSANAARGRAARA